VVGDQFSAKDFRTWSATVYAAVVLAGRSDPDASARQRRLAAARGSEGGSAVHGKYPGRLPIFVHRPQGDRQVRSRRDDSGTIQRSDRSGRATPTPPTHGDGRAGAVAKRRGDCRVAVTGETAYVASDGCAGIRSSPPRSMRRPRLGIPPPAVGSITKPWWSPRLC
jgi:hypothetical protein